MTKAEKTGLLLLLLTFLALGITYGVILPPFENLDEPEHFEVIRYVADTGRLPIHNAPDTISYHIRQEASQPPLYYLLSAGIVRLLDLHAEDAPAFWRFNPRVACGPEAPHLYDNRAVLYHNPHREALPWDGALLTMHTLRLWSTLLQTITVIGTFALARRITASGSRVPLLAAAIVAFNPQFLLVASGVNNDNLVTPLACLILLVTVRSWQERRLDLPRALLLGLLCGAAGLSKLSGWLTLAPPAALFVALWLRRDAARWQLTLNALLIPTVALGIGSWWFWRNWQLYGDPTALQPMLAIVGTRGAPIYAVFEVGLMFRSFWGQLPCSFYPGGFYLVYGALTAAGLLGLAWAWRQLDRNRRGLLLALAGWFVLITVSWLRWNMMTPAPGGRLLFPALPAVAVLLGLGLSGIGHRRVAIPACVVLLGVTAWWTGAAILPAFFAPPPRYPDVTAVRPTHQRDATFGEEIGLLGYDLTLSERSLQLDVTLYWQVLTQPKEDYLLALQLVSPIPGETSLRWNYNSWPGRGNYPTGAWQPGTVVVDRYRFDLPRADFPTQAWDLHLSLYREETGERLPIRIDAGDAGAHLVLTRLRLPGMVPECPSADLLARDIQFDAAVQLTHAAVDPDADRTAVALCWQVLQELRDDYTVFVHLLDEEGELIATGDGPPVGGAFPTSLWQPGDIIQDVYYLPATLDKGAQIAVGFYHPTEGIRLPAVEDGRAVPADAVFVWP